jgi:uncharacterized protein (TIGR02678 family)
MTSALGITLEETRRDERQRAIRLLLRSPLVRKSDDPDGFVAVARQRDWLRRWFLERASWRLVVDVDAGFARLRKIPRRPVGTRPATSRKRDFDRRRYALLCLTLATLDDSPVQTTLAHLAQMVAETSADDPEIDTFDPDLRAERVAFVDVLRWLLDTGVIVERDGDVDRYAGTRAADALFDVSDRLLGQLIAAPTPPALADGPEALLDEQLPDTEEGERDRARHGVFRLVLDEPVAYLDDLTERESRWLEHARGHLYSTLEQEAGLQIERRAEGFAAVDSTGEASFETFPDGGSTVKHAALLLAERLADRTKTSRSRVFTRDEIEDLVLQLLRGFAQDCGWTKAYPVDESGARHLAVDALALLEGFRLVEPVEGGVKARPAVARFAPRTVKRTAPPRRRR